MLWRLAHPLASEPETDIGREPTDEIVIGADLADLVVVKNSATRWLHFPCHGVLWRSCCRFSGTVVRSKKQQVDVAKTLAGAVRSQHGYVPLSRFINPVDRSGLLAFLPQVHFLL